MAKESDLFGVLNVWCSAGHCRFKRNSGYYNKCHNPSVLASYQSFIGGNVHVSGCHLNCEGCTKSDCKLSEYSLHDEETGLKYDVDVSAHDDGLVFILSENNKGEES